MKILSFDTSTEFLSMALAEAGRVESDVCELVGQEHSAVLAPRIKRLLDEAGWRFDDLELVCCGLGPGSFTGIRIGVATLKAISLASGARAIGLSSFAGALNGLPAQAGFVAPLLDARKGQFYTRFFRRQGDGGYVPESEHILAAWPDIETRLQEETFFFGPGLDLCQDTVSASSQARAIKDVPYRVRADILALEAYRTKKRATTNLESIRPLYIYSDDCSIKKI